MDFLEKLELMERVDGVAGEGGGDCGGEGEGRGGGQIQAFEEVELPNLKDEKHGLTHTRYKDMIWKLWKKAPDNPLNQVWDVATNTTIQLLRS
ncbi:hypothetical protein L1987_04315 [Smallanthus sonchifolius]|uniref:Uncharacterized protein n=1 Tax=Smallanthus sonchifolius TaxID=185202 RepID=A0ACB9KD13_9ASTR|nr:hypothetical protein L1987_04315 [Smallanthus sonchifolius]